MEPVNPGGSLRRTRCIAAALAIALAAGTGCDYFKPADPEAPSSTLVIIPNYRQVESTLETMAKGIEAKANGFSAYTGALAENFRATFDAQTINRMEQEVVIPDVWNLGLEETFYYKFVTRPPLNSEYSFRWLVDETQGEDVIEAESAIVHRRYEAFAILAGGGAFYIARGSATLHFTRVSADRWAITRWEDREANGAQIELGEVSMGQRRLEQ